MPMSQPRILVVGMLATAAVAFGAVGVFRAVLAPTPICLRESEPERRAADVQAACRRHLREADRKASAVVDRRAADFSAFIESRKGGAKDFAEALVSIRGKWRVLKKYLPFTDKDGHKKYVEEMFNRHILTQKELEQAVQSAVEGAYRDLDGVENELAVALHEEVLGHSLAPHEIPIATEDFDQAIRRIVAASQHDVVKAGASLGVSEIVANVSAQFLVRLGVSAGILTAGAANSWWTLGVGVVIGIIVDALWTRIDDPQGDIARATVSELDEIAFKGSSAIREEMHAVAEQRHELWHQAALGSGS